MGNRTITRAAYSSLAWTASTACLSLYLEPATRAIISHDFLLKCYYGAASGLQHRWETSFSCKGSQSLRAPLEQSTATQVQIVGWSKAISV